MADMAISDVISMRCAGCKMPWIDLEDFYRESIEDRALTLENPLRFSVCRCWLVRCNFCLAENVIPWLEIE